MCFSPFNIVLVAESEKKVRKQEAAGVSALMGALKFFTMPCKIGKKRGESSVM